MNDSFFSRRPFFNSVIAITITLTTTLALAQEIPWASSAEEVGMSSERLERINQVMQRHIEAGNIQGAVTNQAKLFPRVAGKHLAHPRLSRQPLGNHAPKSAAMDACLESRGILELVFHTKYR